MPSHISNGHSLTTLLTPPTTELVGKAKTFDGDSGYYATGVVPTGSGSLSVRFKGGATSEMVLGVQNAGRTYLGVSPTGELGGGVGNQGWDVIVGTTVLSDSMWYHAVLTWDTSDVKLYLNGVEEYSDSQSGVAASVEDLIIGGHNNGGTAGAFFGGEIFDARIYDRALTASENTDLADVTKATRTALDTVGHWKLDGDDSTQAFDSSGNANHGTKSGTVTDYENADVPYSFSKEVGHGRGNLDYLADETTPAAATRQVRIDPVTGLILVAATTDGLHSYSIDGAGTLTHIAKDDQGGSAFGIGFSLTTGHILLGNQTEGLSSYTMDSAGALTYIVKDDQGGSARGVTQDPNTGYIILANDTSGISSYSIDAAGLLTFIDANTTGVSAFDVVVDPTTGFIILANASGGVLSFSINSAGVFSFIDSDYQGGDAYGVVVHEPTGFILVANGSAGLSSYTIDNAGLLTYVHADDRGGSARDVWVDPETGLIFIANDSAGIQVYSIDSAGTLTPVDSDDQGGSGRGVTVDPVSGFVLLSNDTAGLLSYRNGTSPRDESTRAAAIPLDVFGNRLYTEPLTPAPGTIRGFDVNGPGRLDIVDVEGQDVSYNFLTTGHFPQRLRVKTKSISSVSTLHRSRFNTFH